jgi:hypothetical protein
VRIIKPAILYFVLVFAAGFILGTTRVLLVVPRIGTRTAELIETPVMLVISLLAARWIMGRFPVPALMTERIGIGVLGLAFLLAAECTFVWLQGWPIGEYIATRDPVSGTAYVIALVLFAIMPLWV